MDISDTVWILLAVHIVGTLATYVKLSTRVAVLEASHDNMTDTLKEIKTDVKELLRNSTAS